MDDAVELDCENGLKVAVVFQEKVSKKGFPVLRPVRGVKIVSSFLCEDENDALIAHVQEEKFWSLRHLKCSIIDFVRSRSTLKRSIQTEADLDEGRGEEEGAQEEGEDVTNQPTELKDSQWNVSTSLIPQGYMIRRGVVPKLTRLCVRVIGDSLMEYEAFGTDVDLHFRSMVFLYLLQSQRLSSAKLHQLVGSDMTRLDLSSLSGRVHDAYLAVLPLVPNLVRLNLSKCSRLTAEGMLGVSQHCLKLTHANFSGTGICDKGVGSLSVNLVELDLSECLNLQSHWTRLIPRCANLAILNVSRCTNADWKSLALCVSMFWPKFQQYICRNSGRTDAGSASIHHVDFLKGKLCHGTFYDFTGCRWAVDFVFDGATFPSLHSFSLGSGASGADSLSFAMRCPSLQRLDVSNITHMKTSQLTLQLSSARLSWLSSVTFQQIPLTAEGLAVVLKAAPALIELSLDDCKPLPYELAVGAVVGNAPQLQTLEIILLPKGTRHHAPSVGGRGHGLKFLRLKAIEIGDDSLANVFLAAFNSLQGVSFRWCPSSTLKRADLAPLLRLPSLTSLAIEDGSGIVDPLDIFQHPHNANLTKLVLIGYPLDKLMSASFSEWLWKTFTLVKDGPGVVAPALQFVTTLSISRPTFGRLTLPSDVCDQTLRALLVLFPRLKSLQLLHIFDVSYCFAWDDVRPLEVSICREDMLQLMRFKGKLTHRTTHCSVCARRASRDDTDSEEIGLAGLFDE